VLKGRPSGREGEEKTKKEESIGQWHQGQRKPLVESWGEDININRHSCLKKEKRSLGDWERFEISEVHLGGEMPGLLYQTNRKAHGVIERNKQGGKKR